jgi:hypothetical protein
MPSPFIRVRDSIELRRRHGRTRYHRKCRERLYFQTIHQPPEIEPDNEMLLRRVPHATRNNLAIRWENAARWIRNCLS